MMEMATKGHISDELRVIHQICQETERRKEKGENGLWQKFSNVEWCKGVLGQEQVLDHQETAQRQM